MKDFEFAPLMMETIIIVLLVLWLLGTITGNTFGGMVWVLIISATVLFIARMLGAGRGTS